MVPLYIARAVIAISSVSPFKLTLEKPIIYKKNDICIVIKPESTTVRIIGSGKIN